MSITKPSAAVQAAQIERAILARRRARRNVLVDLVREHTTPARKRGGARYGPAPKQPPHERMQAPTRMSDEQRSSNYSRGRRGRTRRQTRQWLRMMDRDILRDNRRQLAEALRAEAERDTARAAG